MMPPEPVPTPTVTKHHPVHPDADVLTSAHAETAPNRESAQARVRFGNGPDTHLDPDPDPDTDPHPHPPPPRRAGPPGLSRHEPESRPVYSASAHRYVASPLTRWEEGERRRPEYLSGEYRYYPTPVREGIYSIATDANRLSTIFSEENPHACNIV